MSQPQDNVFFIELTAEEALKIQGGFFWKKRFWKSVGRGFRRLWYGTGYPISRPGRQPGPGGDVPIITVPFLK